MTTIKDQIATIASDLVNLEINTIVKPNILGTKMPGPRHALNYIGRDFYIKLKAMGADVTELSSWNYPGSYEAFAMIRKVADKEINERLKRPTTDEGNLYMYYRIRDMSDQIKAIFNDIRRKSGDSALDNKFTSREIEDIRRDKPLPLDLSQDQVVQLRKIWEIGTEEIALQTVIQLDGDVITRVQPKYAIAQDHVLHEIHKQSVSISISFWKDLILIARDLLASLFRLISPVK